MGHRFPEGLWRGLRRDWLPVKAALPGPARDGSLGHDAAHRVDKGKASPLFTTCHKKEMRVEDDEKM